MLSENVSNNYASSLKRYFDYYSSDIYYLTDSSVWSGQSRDSIVNKANDFKNEFKETLTNQVDYFTEAIVRYNNYKKEKNSYEFNFGRYQAACGNYENAVATQNEENIAIFLNRMSDYSRLCEYNTNNMIIYKKQVNDCLSKVMSIKLIGDREWTYIDQRNYHVSYGYNEYGNRAYIDESGCGPTSLAMVASYLTQEDHGVEEVADWAVSNRDAKGNPYRPPGGTSWYLFPDYSATLGINCKLVPQTSSVAQNANSIESELRSGNLIIALMNTGFFTRGGGHYVVLRGLDENGKVIVSDPYHPEKNNDTYDVDFIANQCKNSRYIAVMEG